MLKLYIADIIIYAIQNILNRKLSSTPWCGFILSSFEDIVSLDIIITYSSLVLYNVGCTVYYNIFKQNNISTRRNLMNKLQRRRRKWNSFAKLKLKIAVLHERTTFVGGNSGRSRACGVILSEVWLNKCSDKLKLKIVLIC